MDISDDLLERDSHLRYISTRGGGGGGGGRGGGEGGGEGRGGEGEGRGGGGLKSEFLKKVSCMHWLFWTIYQN